MVAEESAAIVQAFAERDVGALVFLPGENVDIASERACGEEFSGAAFFERRADKEWLAARGEYESPEAFAAVKAQVSEVHRGTGGVGENDSIDLRGDHELPGTFDAGLALGVGEGASLA